MERGKAMTTNACIAVLALFIVFALFKAIYDINRAERRKREDAQAEFFLRLGDQQEGYNPAKLLARRMRSPDEWKV